MLHPRSFSEERAGSKFLPAFCSRPARERIFIGYRCCLCTVLYTDAASTADVVCHQRLAACFGTLAPFALHCSTAS